jgi:S1-C subfamily serine protease
VKVRSYTYDAFTNTYSSYSEGSAVIVGRDSIITNAHVILGSDDIPTGFYEICMTGDFISLPKCFLSARLLAYDTEADLALLRPETPLSSSLVASFSAQKIDLASTVNIYGYPAIGGRTITSTS